MILTNQLKNQHLLWRAGFGPMAEDSATMKRHSQKSLLNAILRSSSHAPEYLDVADNMFKGLMMGIGEVGKMQKKDLSEDDTQPVKCQVCR